MGSPQLPRGLNQSSRANKRVLRAQSIYIVNRALSATFANVWLGTKRSLIESTKFAWPIRKSAHQWMIPRWLWTPWPGKIFFHRENSPSRNGSPIIKICSLPEIVVRDQELLYAGAFWLRSRGVSAGWPMEPHGWAVRGQHSNWPIAQRFFGKSGN